MRKKICLLLAALMCVSLCSCAYMEGTFKVNVDGSVTAKAFMGFTPEVWNMMEQEDGATSDVQAQTTVYYNGQSYIGEYEYADFASVDEFNSEMGESFRLSMGKESFTFMVYNTDEAVTEESQYDIEMLKQSGCVFLFTFEFPYNVKLVKGDPAGITIDRNVLTMDLLNMKSSDYVFYIGQAGTYTDVNADAWYFTAVSYMQSTGLVNGYPDGSFGPGQELMLSHLCQILYNLNPDATSSSTGYWATNAIQYCIDKGYIASHGDINSQNYDVPVTRAEAVSAVVKCYVGIAGDVYEPDTSEVSIPDIAQCPAEFVEAIKRAYAYDIVGGVDKSGTFNPNYGLTRAELCQIAYNLKWAPSSVG